MRSKRHAAGSSRRRVSPGGVVTGSAEPGFALRAAFGVAAALALVLNEAVLALWPLRHRLAAPASSPEHAVAAKACGGPAPAAPATPPPARPSPPPAAPGRPTAPPDVARWEDLGNPLRQVPPASLRLLPGSGPLGDAAARVHRWLTFGMSSVRRPRVEYLGITLSRLFNVLGNGDETAIVVHLADFNEAWVARTSKWLGAGFADEVEAGRLHVIHAPQPLYPLQQAKLAVVRLGGFLSKDLNQPFVKREGERINSRETYWSTSGKLFIYWCQSEGAAVSHRRWGVAATADLQRVKGGTCPAYARAPEDHEVLDPLVIGWEEWDGSTWVVRAEAGVDSIDVAAGEMLKFGDSPQRQWWRSKQNLDYAFLMWYSAGISEYYMQLEDDVQVVPQFLQNVRGYIERKLLGQQWVMVSFSKLGFIGKFFNATRLPQLAEFLLTFNAEMPCDWLVWVWIDILSTEPVTGDIPKDLEKEYDMRQVALYNATALQKLPFMRDDLQVFYKASVYGKDAGPKTGFSYGGQPLFASAAAPVDEHKPPLEPNGARADYPPATVRSTMAAYGAYDASRAYPPGDPFGFWTSDTCWRREQDQLPCIAADKFLEVAFARPEHLQAVTVQMGGHDHPQDYIRNGKLLFSPAGCEQSSFEELGPLNTVTTAFQVPEPHVVGCLRVALGAAQEPWVLVKGIWVDRTSPSPAPARQEATEPAATSSQWTPATAVDAAAAGAQAEEAAARLRATAREFGRAPEPRPAAATGVTASPAPAPHGGEALFSALLAALIGLAAGTLGWVSVCVGSQHCQEGLETVGRFTCWVLTVMVSLDAMFLLALTPPIPPPAGEPTEAPPPQVQEPCTTTVGATAGPEPRALSAEVATVTDPAVQVPDTALDWRALLPGVGRVPLAQLQAAGSAARAPQRPAGGAAAAAPGGEGGEGRQWLAVGMTVGLARAPVAVADAVLRILGVGKGAIVVALLVAGGRGGHSEEERTEFVRSLQGHLKGTTSVHLLVPPAHFYPPSHARTENIDLAFLAMYAAPLAGMYLHLEPDCMLMPDFVTSVRDYLGHLTNIPWIMVLFTPSGFTRKLLKTHLLPRWAQFLVMFPEVPADTLLWDFIDVVGNETAPKSVYLATDASKRLRPDVILQYHKAEALIEHLGDVSSLEGKVQHHYEDYFKKHMLVDTLFDNPAGKLLTNLHGKDGMLQAVYDGSTPANQITCGGHSAPNCAACPQGHGASWCNVDCMWVNGACNSIFKTETVLSVGHAQGPHEAYLELVFDNPRDVEVFNLRMGGSVSAPKNTKTARKANMADPDFDHTLDDAELQFGRGEGDGGQSACRSYDRVDAATGREVFWRSPQSRPATDVRCIRIAIRRAQQRPLIVRGIHVRSAHRGQGGARSGPAPPGARARPAGTPRLASPAGASGPATAAPKPAPSRQPLSRGPTAAAAARLDLEAWAELHFAWVLLVSVAFVSGAFAGVLGCVARAWAGKPAARRGGGRRA